jgi:hypothetical protein
VIPVLGVVAAAGLALAQGAPADLISPLEWGPPTLAAPQGGATMIDCPSAHVCVAADGGGNLITSTDPMGEDPAAWTVSHIDTGTGCGSNAATPAQCAIEAVSCASPLSCAAADRSGELFASSDPGGGTGHWISYPIDTDPWGIRISCSFELLCVAVDLHGRAVTARSPAEGAGAWRTATIDTGPCPDSCAQVGAPGERQLSAVSCPSASLCVAGDWDGNVLDTTDPADAAPRWESTYADTGTNVGITGLVLRDAVSDIACPSASLCMFSDETGGFGWSSDPAAGAWRYGRATPLTGGLGGGGFSSLSCPSAQLCAAVFQAGWQAQSEIAVTYRPLFGEPWQTGMIDRTSNIVGVSCPTSSVCFAIDAAGNVLVGRAAAPSRRRVWRYLVGQLTAAARAVSRRGLLRAGGVSLELSPPDPGRLRVRVLTSGRPGRAVVVASGEAVAEEGQRVNVRIALRRAGRAALRTGRPALTIEATFRPATGHPVTAVVRGPG